MFCGLVERNKFGVLVGFIQFGVNALINLDLGKFGEEGEDRVEIGRES